MRKNTTWAAGAMLLACSLAANAADELLWGDTHLHTNNSFDAFLNGNQTADPETAYRWARGYPVIHPYNRTRVQIGTPLDFLVVTDHAEFYGGIKDIYFDGIQDPDPGFIRSIMYWWNEYQIRDAIDSGNGPAYFRNLLPQFQDPREAAAVWAANVQQAQVPGAAVSMRNAWARLGEVADQYDEPGTFSALLGWEWSANPGGANLHRIVVTDASGAEAQAFQPFSTAQSGYPDDLWAWLEQTQEATGARFVAIPHNSNISRGMMFDDQTLRGDAMTGDYARMRRTWEPIVEVTQIKGDSETHPTLSPDDPFADFEEYPWIITQQAPPPYDPQKGDYIRSALRTGLEIETEIGENPFRFGMIGSTDSHTGLSSAEEPNFWGKMARDSVPENKQGTALTLGPTGWSMSAQGLAAVWAEENTRAAIMDAFRRREVYASTGPRIRVRLFAGHDFVAEDLAAADFAERGYARGVPMGGELGPTADGAAPVFMVRVQRDPASANLDRIQMVKGWLDDAGESHERVYDLAWSGDRQPGSDGVLPAVGDTVDRARASYTNSIGAATLQALWTDSDFDPAQPAFYYVRVLEIPTPRHALMDAVALGLEEPTVGAAVIQERAYTSPVYYRPDGG